MNTLMSAPPGWRLVPESVNECMDFCLSNVIEYEGSMQSHWDRILDSCPEYEGDE